MPGKKADKKKVFISYGHFDTEAKKNHNCKDLAFKFYDRLKAIDYNPWIDKHKLKEGDDWEIFMENGLIESDAILSLMTPYSMRRPDGYCLNEIAMGNVLNKKIIPIMVRYVIPPLSIVRLQYLDFQIWAKNTPEEIFNERFEKILDVIDGTRLELSGAYTYLIRKLNPLNFEAEIDEEIRKFFGRKWIIEEVKNWLYCKEKYKEAKESKLFLLIGDPGMGKTAISAKLCHEFPEIVAYHLIEHGNFMKSDAKECVKSLAYQLSNQIPELVDHLKAANLEDITRENALSLFDRLIVQPLKKISSPIDPKLIVIDAIDEGKKEKSGGKGMENQMIDFISKLYKKTPDWLKLFITTRPEQYILNRLSESEFFYFNAEDKRNDEDLKGFVEKELKRIFPNIPVEKALSKIVERSEGIFLYIRLVLKDLERDPEEGISKIKDPERFPKGLTKWYLENFERQFPDIDNYNKVLRPLFELLVAAQEPLELSLVRKILNWTTYQLNEVKRSLGSFFKITYDGKIEPFHKSLYEWLTDDEATQSTDETYWVDKESGDRTLANYGWNQYQSDIFQLPFYFFRNLPIHISIEEKKDELNTLKSKIKIEKENLTNSELSSHFLQNLLQYFKQENRKDILAEFLLYDKKVRCIKCNGDINNYEKDQDKYRCLNAECGILFDTKVSVKFKKAFLSFSSNDIYIDLIERISSDLEEDHLSIQKTWEDPQVVISFFDSQSINDESCLRDIEKARKYNLEIVPVLIDNCDWYETLLGYNFRQLTPLDFKNWPLTDLEYRARYNELMNKIEEGIVVHEAKQLKNVYISFESGIKSGKLIVPRELSETIYNTFDLFNINCYFSMGQNSHEACITALRNSELVYIFIFPYSGTLIENCNLIEECRAECTLKEGKDPISLAHCEYKNVIAERILNGIYLSGKDLNNFLSKEAKLLKEDVPSGGVRLFFDLDHPSNIQLIIKNLVEDLMTWFFEGRLDLPDFVGRREELEILLKSIENFEKIEVWGSSGVGKTTLVQVALLIEKLKGKDIISIGTSKSYASGSGYGPFIRKFSDVQHYVYSTKEITLYDILEATANFLPDFEEVNKKSKDEIIQIISDFFNREKTLLFIDDFQLADRDVQDLVKSMKSVILASRKITYLSTKEVHLSGIEGWNKLDLLNLLCTRFHEDIPNNAKEKIIRISEGHPISMELLVKNYQLIDFNRFEEFDLKNLDEDQVKHYFQRILEEIGSQEAYDLFINLSILNAEIDTNINRESVLKSYKDKNSRKIFKNLIDRGMIKKKKGKEVIYEFAFKHIQSALRSLADQKSHEKAIKYYQNKLEILGDNIDDSKEIEYHKLKLNSEDI